MFEQRIITAALVLSGMDTSTTETATNAINSQRSDSGSPSTKRTVRALLGVEGVSFLLAALIHAGVLVQGYEHREAMIAESTIGIVLLFGLATTWLRSRSIFSIATAVQVFALLGTFVGVFTIVVGVGPRTIPDILYHVGIVVVLAVGLGLSWRGRKTDSI